MQLPSSLRGSESLARYLTQSNHFNLNTYSVRPRAFDPPPNLCLSVFRIDSLSAQEIWTNGQINVINRMLQPHPLYGFANIKVSEVQATSLTVDPDDNPPRHASIMGWPQDKSERILMTQELASKAKLVLRSHN